MATQVREREAPDVTPDNGSASASLFTFVSPDEIGSLKTSRESPSGNLLDQFLASGQYAARINPAALSKQGTNLQAFASRLNAHARKHDMPAVAKFVKGTVYIARLDVDKAGNAVDNWRDTPAAKGRSRKAE